MLSQLTLSSVFSQRCSLTQVFSGCVPSAVLAVCVCLTLDSSGSSQRDLYSANVRVCMVVRRLYVLKHKRSKPCSAYSSFYGYIAARGESEAVRPGSITKNYEQDFLVRTGRGWISPWLNLMISWESSSLCLDLMWQVEASDQREGGALLMDISELWTWQNLSETLRLICCCRIRRITFHAAELGHYMLAVICRWPNAETQFDLALPNDACKPHWPPVRSSDLASHCPVMVFAHTHGRVCFVTIYFSERWQGCRTLAWLLYWAASPCVNFVPRAPVHCLNCRSPCYLHRLFQLLVCFSNIYQIRFSQVLGKLIVCALLI